MNECAKNGFRCIVRKEAKHIMQLIRNSKLEFDPVVFHYLSQFKKLEIYLI